MKVLYVNHTAAVSGGERSLLSLLSGLPDSVDALVAAPRGQLQATVRALGVPVATITGTAGSLRLHPAHTPRAVAEMALAAAQVRRLARRSASDVLHANSIRAGLVLALARAPGVPTVVHVRDCLPPGALSTATLRLIAASATTVIANSRYTASSVLSAAPAARVEVIYNPVDLQRWDPARLDRGAARARLGEVVAGRLLLGVVAQLSPWKGQDTAIEALRLLREEGRDAHLLLIGSAKFVARSTRFDNERYVAHLHALAAAAGLEDRISWLGEREDVPELVRALDVLLLPSWEEPFGRSLIEAMALGVPVIATNVGGPAEILDDGVEGWLLAPRDPAPWARAIAGLADDPQRAAEIGRAGRRRVEERFALERHVTAVLALYARVVARAAHVADP
ncbi:MAG TPA: glycosyltransferase family 4 protein [Solirubrobacteraceae bacterium]|jgi:glycosyltransferase involved in cell wall biosynthesis|nr:glycosyltransferase family 4 protein [Solirubrobacteraceae bacterium]